LGQDVEEFLPVNGVGGVALDVIIDDDREVDFLSSGFEALILRAEVSNDYTASPICIMSVNGVAITGQSMVLTDFIIPLQGRQSFFPFVVCQEFEVIGSTGILAWLRVLVVLMTSCRHGCVA
jgi:hypothetical protein